jgi:predicted PurR-regulated permease PerM
MVFPDRRTASALLTILLFAIVLGHELDIHPLLAIFTLMVGGAVGGIVGIYLSVPLVTALRVIYRRFASPPVGATVPDSLVDRPEPRRETSVMAWWPLRD